jgi:hypothetical protein
MEERVGIAGHRRRRLGHLDLGHVVGGEPQHLRADVDPDRLVVAFEDLALDYGAGAERDDVGAERPGQPRGQERCYEKPTCGPSRHIHLQKKRPGQVYDGAEEDSNVPGRIGSIRPPLASI